MQALQLDSRTGRRAISAEDAAITLPRAKRPPTLIADIHDSAGEGGHGLDVLLAAVRTGQVRCEGDRRIELRSRFGHRRFRFAKAELLNRSSGLSGCRLLRALAHPVVDEDAGYRADGRTSDVEPLILLGSERFAADPSGRR